MAKARTPRTSKPKVEAEKSVKKVLQMPETTASVGSNGNTGSNGNSKHSSVELESEIRRRAYELYARRGYTHGHHEQDWLEAERQVLGRNAKKHTA
jgi:Protein of unknown function (DUF2934)